MVPADGNRGPRLAASSELTELLRVLREQRRTTVPTVEELRAGVTLLSGMSPLPTDVHWQPAAACPVGAEWVHVAAAGDRVILYAHGGSFVMGSPASHRDLSARLARAARASVLAVDYRLAPEHPFPAAAEDLYAAYFWLLGQGRPPGRIAVVGDGAGGGLVLSTLTSLRDQGAALPAAAALLSPWVDLELGGASMDGRAPADPLLSRELLAACAAAYLAGGDPRMPLASPLLADLGSLPPLLLQAGTAEVLLDDAVRLAERARDAGVAVELETYPDAFHVWHLFAATLPEGREALGRVGAFLRRAMA